jgi:hypothetical protein
MGSCELEPPEPSTSPFFAMGFFDTGSRELLVQADLKPLSS